MLDLVSAIAEALSRSPQGDLKALARSVLERLAQADVIADIHEAIHAAELSARAAHAERDDLFADPRNSRVAAEVATAAVARLFDKSLGASAASDLAAAQSIASEARYRDWRFEAVPVAGGGIGVNVVATQVDTYHPDRTFTTTRFAEVTSTVEEACFRAALLVEYHEAQERFRVKGKAVFDSHAAENMAPPTNLRPTPQ